MVRLLLLLSMAIGSAACDPYGACPTGQALQRSDLPCTCGKEALQGLSSCGAVYCDGDDWRLEGDACETGWTVDPPDSGDSG